MALQYHSRISREIQSYTETCSPNLSQLVRNLVNILGSVAEEIGLAFEDELALEGHGASLLIFDGRYSYPSRVEGNCIPADG